VLDSLAVLLAATRRLTMKRLASLDIHRFRVSIRQRLQSGSSGPNVARGKNRSQGPVEIFAYLLIRGEKRGRRAIFERGHHLSRISPEAT